MRCRHSCRVGKKRKNEIGGGGGGGGDHLVSRKSMQGQKRVGRWILRIWVGLIERKPRQ